MDGEPTTLLDYPVTTEPSINPGMKVIDIPHTCLWRVKGSIILTKL